MTKEESRATVVESVVSDYIHSALRVTGEDGAVKFATGVQAVRRAMDNALSTLVVAGIIEGEE